MFGSEILEVAIGIIFVYILISIICTAIREGIEAWMKSRAAFLEYGIRELLHDKSAEGIAKSFFNHPLIFSLFSDDYKPGSSDKRPSMFSGSANLPSYIPSKNFALALMDIAARGPVTDAVSSDPNSPALSLDSVKANILNINNPAVQRVLLTAIDSAQGDLNKALANIEAWFDSAMERISGWYKRSTQWVIFWIALVVAVGLNVNTITIADFLYRNNEARATLVARAGAAATDPEFLKRTYEEVKDDIEALSLPIGWKKGWGAPRQKGEPGAEGLWNNGIAPILGLLLTAFAATLGAPFWFDVLKRVMVIRSTIKPPEKSPGQAAEGSQAATGQPAGDSAQGGAGGATGTLPTPPGETPTSPRDNESDIDGCDVEIKGATSDEELPASEGGVA